MPRCVVARVSFHHRTLDPDEQIEDCQLIILGSCVAHRSVAQRQLIHYPSMILRGLRRGSLRFGHKRSAVGIGPLEFALE